MLLLHDPHHKYQILLAELQWSPRPERYKCQRSWITSTKFDAGFLLPSLGNNRFSSVRLESMRFYSLSGHLSIPSKIYTSSPLWNSFRVRIEPPVKPNAPRYRTPDRHQYRGRCRNRDFLILAGTQKQARETPPWHRWRAPSQVPQGFERRETDRFILAVPSNRTEYGDIIADEVIIQEIKNGTQHEDAAVAEKWKNTWDFFKSIK
jgi:hypothetical protein